MLLGSQASAQEQPFNWTGFYLGIHGGAATGEADGSADLTGDYTACIFACVTDTYAFGAEDSYRVGGLFGGGQIGFDYAAGSFLLGVKADISGGSIDGDGSVSVVSISPLGLGPFDLVGGDLSTDLNWMATVRGRAGVIAPQGALLYLTGGLAVADVDSQFDYFTLAGTGSLSDSDTRLGWTAGIGAEAPVSNRVTVGFEYLYTDLGSSGIGTDSDTAGAIACPFGCFGFETDYDLSAENDLHIHTWRAGVNIKLGGRR